AAPNAADVRSLESALVRLYAAKKRHEPGARTACQDYEVALAEKRAIDDQKVGVKEKLDNDTREVIGLYEQTINKLLDDFQAGFRLTGTTHGYPGGVAGATYQILINETAVDLGGPDTPVDTPSFKNTLSSGDKSTLALAIF